VPGDMVGKGGFVEMGIVGIVGGMGGGLGLGWRLS
jgi:hypothetical protein